MSRILILFAHPAFEKSRVHYQLLATIRGMQGVTVHDLYETYPDLNIDVRQEQGLLLQHDIILFQHPLYWYSAPAMIKQWQDLVLEHGWAYGRTGTALRGKRITNVISAGTKEDAYQPDGWHQHPLTDFLLPYKQTATLCNMQYLAPFVVYGTHQLDATSISEQAISYKQFLETLRDR
ncbi:glutathione-regulated potassium-efflux system oxidoreductase KefF [Chitinophaga sancti]|uniref:Glutathione-regulated potassium-efflux system ancillary protein KefG n=1 Tax=Chitinophaga sancti TaxID=1004 RepID=A0A1K1P0J7_9BACT|nr:NAD(P)H-dependent oxidoreductase [Chitinophaga sancti]WQD60290.1 NAD(P)H-dependent oxidoreductase [Chitinophaga sancti]WQG87582.1 NAD(P)H-dependent oxidoreductase [Chitinophaga sancti]SFW40182.1 glutathione-regulated potassium-efflux system ancillary protein KefG [Chitinophaga sancti]